MLPAPTNTTRSPPSPLEMPPLACIRMTMAAISTVTCARVCGPTVTQRWRIASADITAKTRYPAAVAEIVSVARAATDKMLSLKLSPNTSDILGVAEAAEGAGADALTVANTLPGMRIDIKRRRPALGNTTGGLSGGALMPVNLALVWKVAGHVSIPVIGSGGIGDTGDALEFLAAGAAAVQVGTALFANPAAPAEIAKGLQMYMEEKNLASMDELVGMAREERRTCAKTA